MYDTCYVSVSWLVTSEHVLLYLLILFFVITFQVFIYIFICGVWQTEGNETMTAYAAGVNNVWIPFCR